jgi:hypothetical protein
MQVHQIVIRPQSNMVIVLYEDGISARQSLTFDSSGNTDVANLLAECQRRLPSPDKNPAKAEIESQIDELQKRILSLKEAIGQPA